MAQLAQLLTAPTFYATGTTGHNWMAQSGMVFHINTYSSISMYFCLSIQSAGLPPAVSTQVRPSNQHWLVLCRTYTERGGVIMTASMLQTRPRRVRAVDQGIWNTVPVRYYRTDRPGRQRANSSNSEHWRGTGGLASSARTQISPQERGLFELVPKLKSLVVTDTRTSAGLSRLLTVAAKVQGDWEQSNPSFWYV